MTTCIEDLRALESLEHGDSVEWRKRGTNVWRAGTVVWNGGYETHWAVEDEHGVVHHVKYDQVRANGTDPWRNWSFT